MAKVPSPKHDAVGEGNWRRIKATVKPLKRERASPAGLNPPIISQPVPVATVPKRSKGCVPLPLNIAPAVAPTKRQAVGTDTTGIDRAWERKLSSGRLSPDMTVDLHGHHLSGAHVALSRALDRGVMGGARVILVIAGKERGLDEAPRGAIRRELTSWLAHSHHASRILSVRNAHPRHGGAGAVYIILRKAV